MIWNRNRKNESNSDRSYSEPKDMLSETSSLRRPFGGEQNLSATSAIEETFALKLRNSTTPSDPAIKTVWEYVVPVLQSNEKKLLLSFVGGELYIINVPTSQFPEQIYLRCSTQNGYLDNEGNATHTLAIFRIREIMTGSVGSVPTYTLIYSLMEPATWDIGLTRNLSFTVADENGDYDLPLPMTINVEMKIIHVCY